MKLYQKIITGGLVIAGLAGLVGCDSHPDTPKADYKSKTSIAKVNSAVYLGSSIAAADMDDDGLVDLLSTDGDGNVYFHKNQGDNVFAKFEKPIFKVNVAVYLGSSIAAADMNGDGKIDLMSTDGDGNVYLHLNQGNMQFE
jgi:sugar lactone lactonase YvrE